MNRQSSSAGIRKIILKNGDMRYEARINRIGEKPISKRFKTLKEAKAWKSKTDVDIDCGIPVHNPKKILISRIIDDYLANRTDSLDPLPANRVTEFARVKLDLGAFSIHSMERADLKEWIKALVEDSRGKYKDGSPKPPFSKASARKIFYALKVAVEWHAAEYNYHLNEYLFKLSRGTIPSAWAGKRERRLSNDEEAKLYTAGIERKDTYSSQDWKSIIGFALETAMREQEIVLCRWSDIAPNGMKLIIPAEHSKTKQSRIVLLSGVAREIIKQQKEGAPESATRIFYQFPNPESLCDAFARLTKRAGIDNLRFHDLRHEATSRLCELGKLGQMHIMEMTGHSSMTTFRGYLHLLSHENSPTLD